MKFEFLMQMVYLPEKGNSYFPTFEGEKVYALRQTIIAIHANQRQGNASTKLRSEVSGSGKKIYRQKGLGVGRAGDKSNSTPWWRCNFWSDQNLTIRNLIKK